MDQAKNDVSQTAAFARRVVCRTLTVVGGIAAGTALAWSLSTAAASADAAAPLPPVEERVQTVVAEVEDFAAPVESAVESAVGTVARHLQDPPPPPKNPLRDLGAKVKDATEKLRSDTARGIERLPGTADSGARNAYPADGHGRSALPAAPALAPVVAAVAPAAGIDADATAHRTAQDRAFADGMSRRGSPEPVLPMLPGLPNVPAPLPFAPTGVPTTGGHSSAGNPADSHLFAALPWQDNVFSLTRGGIAAASDAATFGRPGAQPGVAPD
ncbi:hypothetical protein [Actinophytocola glycyrrhizae]|uniref:Uncharacterized protein n=1 Tax=Actinophytocola glycyrrhizae TaxID=2044873 RepID=A0ABV9S066_9PSEU